MNNKIKPAGGFGIKVFLTMPRMQPTKLCSKCHLLQSLQGRYTTSSRTICQSWASVLIRLPCDASMPSGDVGPVPHALVIREELLQSSDPTVLRLDNIRNKLSRTNNRARADIQLFYIRNRHRKDIRTKFRYKAGYYIQNPNVQISGRPDIR